MNYFVVFLFELTESLQISIDSKIQYV